MNNGKLIHNPYIEIISQKLLFENKQNEQHKAPSIIMLSNGILIVTFALHQDSKTLESYVVLTKSNNNGVTWTEPEIL